MTKREAAIVSAYTGFLIGEFQDFHEYAEEILGRPIQTIEMISEDIWELFHEKSLKDFQSIEVDEENIAKESNDPLRAMVSNQIRDVIQVNEKTIVQEAAKIIAEKMARSSEQMKKHELL